MLSKKCISVVISLLLLITVIMPTNVFAAEKGDDIMPLSVIQGQYRDASTVFQTSFEDGTILIEQVNNDETKSLFTTILPDKRERIEYYDRIEEVIYTYIDGELIDKFDVEQARQDYTVKIELTDEDEKTIREILELAEGDVDIIHKMLGEKGIVGVYVELIDGEPIIMLDTTYPATQMGSGISDIGLLAVTKTINPTKQSIYNYQPSYSYGEKDRQLKYHSVLKRTITSRVYQFANNYAQKGKISKYVGVGTSVISLVQAAAVCLTTQSWFTGLINFYNVSVSAGDLKERLDFISEQYYTYNGEKSGWTYDYVTPNAVGRYKGHVRTHHNANAGKITMGWTGTSTRYNFCWTNTVHPKAYGVANSTILNKAYDMYTSFIITHGYYPY